MDDALRIVVLGLEWFALWLERSPLQVAWPVLFVLVFQVFLFVVHVLQWFSRGMFLRVACDYPVTTTKGSSPCKNRAIGEWHRCHKHGRRWQRRTDSHVVDPDLPRWQTIEGGFERNAATVSVREPSGRDLARSACCITAAMRAGRVRSSGWSQNSSGTTGIGGGSCASNSANGAQASRWFPSRSFAGQG